MEESEEMIDGKNRRCLQINSRKINSQKMLLKTHSPGFNFRLNITFYSDENIIISIGHNWYKPAQDEFNIAIRPGEDVDFLLTKTVYKN